MVFINLTIWFGVLQEKSDTGPYVVIEFIDVSKYYPTKKGRKFVFKSLNIKLPENKNIGVLGLNGSGKSTLLRMIAGTDYPNKGVVSVKGSVSWPLGLSGGTQGSMTGRENAEFVSRYYFAQRRMAMFAKVC